MNRFERTNPLLSRAALMGLAVALPMAVAAESVVATPVHPGEIVAAQRSEPSDTASWVDRVFEAARNLLGDSTKSIALPVIPVVDAIDEVCEPAVATDRGIDEQPDRLDHALIDLPPPMMV